jgi:deoxycytidylate deaminase
MEGFDANDREIARIADAIVKNVKEAAPSVDEEKLRRLLDESPLDDLTEYGRPVHAEMEALLACARSGISTAGGTVYTTTFPCHNCAKHIVAAGIVRVVYVEPYPKSKALTLHGDSIALDNPLAMDRVRFVPFVGVAARRYFDLFSMRLGDGLEMKRKKNGLVVPWQRTGARPRIRMAPFSYLERETKVTAEELDKAVEQMQRTAEAKKRTDAPPDEHGPGPTAGQASAPTEQPTNVGAAARAAQATEN